MLLNPALSLQTGVTDNNPISAQQRHEQQQQQQQSIDGYPEANANANANANGNASQDQEQPLLEDLQAAVVLLVTSKLFRRKSAFLKEVRTVTYCTTSYHTIPYHSIPYQTIPCQTRPHHTTPYHTIPYQHTNSGPGNKGACVWEFGIGFCLALGLALGLGCNVGMAPAWGVSSHLVLPFTSSSMLVCWYVYWYQGQHLI